MFSQLKKYLVAIFGISSVEANGLIIIFFFIFLLLLGSLLLPEINSSRYDSYLTDRKILDSIVDILNKDTVASEFPAKKINISRLPRYFAFNPNFISKSGLDSLGFPSFLAERIIKFRQAGGDFKIKKDMLKIYGLSQQFYDRIESYIILPEIYPNFKVTKVESLPGDPISKIREKFDINSADSASLNEVGGIGPVLAGRIIKYRNSMGGFVQLDQLDEIYGLKGSGLNNLKNTCFIGEGFLPVKINVNFAEWADLVRHPYIDKDLAQSIIKYRDAKGPYHSMEDLRNVKSIHDSTILKISRYIDF